jgi:hypothetical protein
MRINHCAIACVLTLGLTSGGLVGDRAVAAGVEATSTRTMRSKTWPVEINLKAMPTRFGARHTSGGGSPAGHDPKAPPALDPVGPK